MQTGKNIIRNLFDGSKIFNVPVYQRAYSWEKEKHLQEFLDDIVGQFPERKYFLGTYLLHIKENEDDFQIIDIIDGQQRLTTFIIFMKVLLDLMLKNNSTKVSERTRRIYIKDGDVYKLKLSNEDSSFLHQYIFEDNLPESINITTPSQRLLIEAKNFFFESLTRFDIKILEKIYDTAVNAEILLYVVEEVHSATQIFELLNDRGKKLTDLEAIKSFLMYSIGLVTSNPIQLIEDIQHNFAEIYRLLERYDINDDDVLRYHNIAFDKENEISAKENIKKKVNSLIKSNKKDEAKETMIKYSRDLKKSFSIFVSLYTNEDKIEELDDLFMLGRVAPFYPILMIAKEKGKKELVVLIKKLVKFNFRAILSNLRSNAGESYIFSAHKNEDNVSDLIGCFCEENWWNVNIRAKEVINYRNHYERANYNIIKYILFKYENKLRRTKGFSQLGIEEYYNESSREKLSIEHITAQRAKGIKMTKKFEEEYLHNIGNLVIDSVASNSSKGNKNTNNKIASYNKAPIMSQNEIEDFSCDWENINSVKQFIEDREIIMKKFILDEFGI